MKKIILILVLATFMNCEKDEQDCKCDVDVVIANPTGQSPRYTITGVPSDCNGNVDFDSLNLPSNHWYERTRNCN